MRVNYKKLATTVGMSLLLTASPIAAFSGTINNGQSNISGKVLNAVDISTLKNNNKVTATDIVLDNDLTDWSNVTQRVSTVQGVNLWKVAISSDYSTLYFCYEGMSSSEWDYNYAGQNKINIQYKNGVNDASSAIQFAAWSGTAIAKNAWYGDITGAEAVTLNEAHGNTQGPYVLESAIPMDFFANGDFTITFAGTTVDITQVEVLDGNGSGEEETGEALYNGITIDGTFSDWAAVTKYEAGCPNEAHSDCINEAAMVFDGDYVYIYIKDGKGGSAFGAGSHSNGQYSIKTDLGNELVFQLIQDGGINGVEGAECIHIGRQWEISIPKAVLPFYNKTISFGLYLTEPFITDVANLVDEGPEQDISSDGIEYDGLYGDWNMYPHTTIQYATAGTHYQMVDAKAALACNGRTLLGHVVTTMPAHLKQANFGFTQGITIMFNGDESQVFYPRNEFVDSDGNINWNSQKSGLSEGTYEYYLFSTDAWHTSENINNTNEFDNWYGKMIITVGANKDECEFYLDLEKIANKLGCDASDFKRIDANFSNLGYEWVTTAGASSGAWLGLGICILATGGVLVRQSKKNKEQVQE